MVLSRLPQRIENHFGRYTAESVFGRSLPTEHWISKLEKCSPTVSLYTYSPCSVRWISCAQKSPLQPSYSIERLCKSSRPCAVRSHLYSTLGIWSGENPFAPSFHELVQHHSDIRQDKSTYIKPKELRGVSGAELKTDMRLRCVLQPGIFDLSCNLIYNRSH